MRDLIKENIKSLKAYEVKEEKYRIKLNANESPYNILKDLEEKIITNISKEEINRYPDDNCTDLKSALANYAGVREENIICGNGSDQIIKMIVDAFVDKEDVVVTHSPTFSMYRIITMISGGEVIEIESDENFKVNIDGIITAANGRNAKLIFLCTPNNPTGNIIKREDILKVVEGTRSIVVVDEAYYEFCGQTIIDKIGKYNRLIVLRTLSKAFGLAGLRIGYGVADYSLIEILNKVRSPYNLNTISQIIGKEVLDNLDIVNMYIEEIKEERKLLEKELLKIRGLEVVPSCSNFVLIRTDKYMTLLKAFKDNSILIRELGNKRILKDCLRITIGTKEENKKVIQLIKEVY